MNPCRSDDVGPAGNPVEQRLAQPGMGNAWVHTEMGRLVMMITANAAITWKMSSVPASAAERIRLHPARSGRT